MTLGISLTIGIFAAWLLISLSLSQRHKHRLRTIAATRSATAPMEEFVAAFPAVPSKIAASCYSALQRALGYDWFPIQPGDELEALLHLDQGTVDSLLEDLLEEQLGFLPRLPPGSVITAGDFVRYLHNIAQPRAAADAGTRGRHG